jgi:hypothetical protein
VAAGSSGSATSAGQAGLVGAHGYAVIKVVTAGARLLRR